MVALACLAGPCGHLAAQQATPPKCAGPAFHGFDYWAGRWVVRNAKGAEVGHSHVSRVSDGCAVLEEWTAAAGSTGTSLNYYTPADSLWRQVWVGGGGQILNLVGKVVDGVMTLEDHRQASQGPIMDRIRWIPMDDGKVEQRWEISGDDGKTWTVAFQGFYEPVTAPDDSAGR